MSTEKPKPTGGFAFPAGGGTPGLDPCGMTLRDYFAAKAMPWVCSDLPNCADFYKRAAIKSYELADEMLEARK